MNWRKKIYKNLIKINKREFTDQAPKKGDDIGSRKYCIYVGTKF